MNRGSVVGPAAIWTLFAVGVAKELVGANIRGKLLRLQFAVVAAVIPALWLVMGEMGIAPAILTVAGGIAYLLGAWLPVNDRPRLAPHVFSHHGVSPPPAGRDTIFIACAIATSLVS